jgi:hypothetical protein
MKSSHSRGSNEASRDDANKPTDGSRATRHRRGVVRGEALKAANASAEPNRALAAHEESLPCHEQTLPVREVALRARETSAQTRAGVERLIGQMQEANERLVPWKRDTSPNSRAGHPGSRRCSSFAYAQ